ncbi:MAG: hypothetical protein MJ211_03740 [Bacteroidales bacterium]|nr:hypothetical protein [Bacteroidales bacterium]
MKKLVLILIVIFTIALVGFLFIFFTRYISDGEGVQAGQLTTFMHKGFVIKTYEGKIIQTGLKNAKGAIESNTVEFSVEDQEIADSLMRCTGRDVELHYKHYPNSFFWRGEQKVIVDKIVSVSKSTY